MQSFDYSAITSVCESLEKKDAIVKLLAIK